MLAILHCAIGFSFLKRYSCKFKGHLPFLRVLDVAYLLPIVIVNPVDCEICDEMSLI